jgi:aspartokinase
LRMTHWDELLRWVEATALCAALLVDKVQVWKDVNGKLTFDPRMVLGDARAECLARRSG